MSTNIDINKKYRTRDGREVNFLHRAPEGWPYTHPWRGVIEGMIHQWTDSGAYHYNHEEDRTDLVEIREPRTFYLIPREYGHDVYGELQLKWDDAAGKAVPWPGQVTVREVIEEATQGREGA